MKKLSFALLCSVVFLNVGYSQQELWKDVPGFPLQYHAVNDLYADSLDNYLYVTGDFHEFNGLPYKGIARLNGQEWDSLAGGADKLHFYAYSPRIYTMTRYQSDLYVGGVFSDLDGKPIASIGKWNGSEWDPLPVPPFHGDYWSNDAWVMELAVINNKLFMCGEFYGVTGQSCRGVAAWNGTKWETKYSLDFACSPGANSIAKYKGDLYIGGNFSNCALDVSKDTIMDIARWYGTGWLSVGGSIKGDGIVDALAVYKGELYVGGYFFKSAGNAGNLIMKWDGHEWSDVGGGLWGGQVSEMQVHDGKLYVVGTFDQAGGVPAKYIAIWDGENWCGLGGYVDNPIYTIEFYHDTLYVGGNFFSINGDSSKADLAKWLGGNYVAVCGNTTAVEEQETQKAKVFPNPTTDILNIQLPEAAQNSATTYKIINLLSKTVLSGTANKTLFKLNVQNLASGMYSCVLMNKNGSYTAKFVKR